MSAEEQLRNLSNNCPLYRTWEEYVTKCTAKDFLIPIKNVIKVSTTDTIRTVLGTLFSYHIQAVPVYDLDKDTYRAFIDTYDIVAYILQLNSAIDRQNNNIQQRKKHEVPVMPKDHDVAHREHKHDSSSGYTGNRVLNNEIAELDIPVHKAMNYSEEDYLFMLPATTKLREIIYVMGPGRKHRVWLYDTNTSQAVGMITQSKMFHILVEDLVHFPHIANRTLEETGLAAHENVICVDINTTILNAFQLMIENQVRGLAVTNEKGVLVNSFTSSDVKSLALFDEFFDNLHLPIKSFLEKGKKYFMRRMDIITASPSDSIYQTIQKLQHHRIHRIFLTSQDGKPVRVLSLSDLLIALWKYCD
eukprot:TRINITY_DN8935_c0_g1_i1.p1 TRINITY_DN8935_c0_g1~~TRINITY_DN8935_c0_g1_i1.p1  ORF type:complete len:360 (-),score=35.19 TRINITY_DN8935_c0_g1_i1:9-1088(-)